MPDPVKKNNKKRKAEKKTKAGKAGYGAQNRTGIAPKKKKVKTTGPGKKAVKYLSLIHI